MCVWVTGAPTPHTNERQPDLIVRQGKPDGKGGARAGSITDEGHAASPFRERQRGEERRVELRPILRAMALGMGRPVFSVRGAPARLGVTRLAEVAFHPIGGLRR